MRGLRNLLLRGEDLHILQRSFTETAGGHPAALPEQIREMKRRSTAEAIGDLLDGELRVFQQIFRGEHLAAQIVFPA